MPLLRGLFERSEMNAKQQSVLQMVQSKKWLEWKTKKAITGNLSYSTYIIGDTIFVNATDVGDLSWFTKATSISLTIGPKGGITMRSVRQF